MVKRRITRLECRDLPQISVLDQKTRFQVGNESRTHQRGLAASGTAHHSHKSMGVQLLQKGVRLFLAPEIVKAVSAFKRTQTDKWVLHGDIAIHCPTPAARSRAVIWGSMWSDWLLSRMSMWIREERRAGPACRRCGAPGTTRCVRGLIDFQIQIVLRSP